MAATQLTKLSVFLNPCFYNEKSHKSVASKCVSVALKIQVWYTERLHGPLQCEKRIHVTKMKVRTEKQAALVRRGKSSLIKQSQAKKLELLCCSSVLCQSFKYQFTSMTNILNIKCLSFHSFMLLDTCVKFCYSKHTTFWVMAKSVFCEVKETSCPLATKF